MTFTDDYGCLQCPELFSSMSLIAFLCSLYKPCWIIAYYTEWPRKNATTLIVNFINIVDETELFFISFGRTFICQQNDTMISLVLGKVSGL